MNVKVKVFEDYHIQFDTIRPVGKSTIKTLNTNDIRKALDLFLKIKSYNDVIRFAKSYGLLNDYSFHIEWISEKTDDNLSWTEDNGKHALKKTIAKDSITIAKDNITQQDKLAYLEYKKELEKSEALFDEFDVAPNIYVRILVNGNIFSVFCSHISDTCRGITSGYPYKIPIEEDLLDNDIMNNAVMSQYVYIVNNFLNELYSYDRNKINTDFVYGLIGENLGFEKENGWVDFKHKLKALAKIENEKEAISIMDMLNKELSNPVVLEYAYKRKANGKYIIKPLVGFKSIYESFMWLVVSKDMSIKICPVCGNVFVAKRSDTVYCSAACLMRHRRSSPKK